MEGNRYPYPNIQNSLSGLVEVSGGREVLPMVWLGFDGGRVGGDSRWLRRGRGERGEGRGVCEGGEMTSDERGVKIILCFRCVWRVRDDVLE